MTTTLIHSPTSEQRPANTNSVLLKNVSWQTYEALLQDVAEQPGIRITYDRGLLEITMSSAPHEKYKKLLGRFVENLSEELDIDICSLGSLTCKREDLARGLEPDQCYYIQNEPLVWDKEQIDLNEDPPPDLAIEMDVTSSSINRLDIYANLGVPEVWRYDGRRVTFYELEGEQYVERSHSSAFPFVPSSEIMRFLQLRKTTKEKPLMRSFREWVKSQIQPSE